MDEFTDTLKYYQTQRQYEQHGSVYESPRQPPSDADERRVQHLGEPNRSFQEERRAIMSLLQDENVQAHQTFSSSISSIGRSGGSPSTAGTRFHPHPPASPRLPQPPLRPSAAKNMFVSPNAESFEDEPDGIANVYVHELEKMHAKRRRTRAMAFRVCILLTVSFFLLAIVFVPVVVVELLTRNNNDEPPPETVVIDTGHNETTPDNETTPGNVTADCRIEPVHQECATNGVMHTLPECILENYASLRNDWLPAYDNGWAAYQNGSAEIKSCEPRNLALVTMATDMEREEGSMPNNDSLLNRYVLYTLYFATTGNEWKDSSNWLSSILPECTWFGIHCEVDTNIIHTIELHFNNLDGTIPTEIALLPNLTKLVLESNRLVRELPTVLGNMTSLESLRVQGNRLSGTLPISVVSSPFMRKLSSKTQIAAL